MDGDTLTFSSAPLTSIANGSLQNKIFPPKKEIFKSLQKAFDRNNSVPSIPLRHITDLWQTPWPLHHQHLHQHITHRDITLFKQMFPGSVFHNEDKRATSLRIFVHVCTSNASRPPLRTPTFFDVLTTHPNHSSTPRLTS